MAAAQDLTRVLARLRDTSQPFPARDLYQLSDLDREELGAVQAAWPEIDSKRRQAIIEDLAEISEANFEVNFNAMFRLGLEDGAPGVRAAAISGLWEDEDPGLIAPLIDFLQHDPAVEVRAAAAGGLGRFVYLGEIDDLPAPQARRIVGILLAVLNAAGDQEVRRRALESIAFSSRPEVAPLIEQSYGAHDEKLRASAVFAMGRSADPRWAEPVNAELRSDQPEMRFEAARAAGELELEESLPALVVLLDDDAQAVRNAATWSLSQVGGPEAERALQGLWDEADGEQAEYLEEALANLAFNNDVHNLALLDLDEGDDETGSRLN